MKAPRPNNRTDAPELTTKEARQADRHYNTFVVLAIALALLVVAGVALMDVRF